jgi:[protein-PII] uridylyltransferase
MSRLHHAVEQAKQRLAAGYEELRRRHEAGSSGTALSADITRLRDEVVLALFEAALDGLAPADAHRLRRQTALVAHGGYGRRDVAPFSDVDLMLLRTPGDAGAVAPLANRLLRDVFDSGLVLGHSVRTPREACQLACQDAMICSSLVEARLLAGNDDLYRAFHARFRRRVRSRRGQLMAAMEKARREERIRYGETVFLLEPNVKRSPGGLRDIQLLRWIGQARYGRREPRDLLAAGLWSQNDLLAVEHANEFLLRLRNEMHFHAGKAGDVLDRTEQVRIAELWGYEGGKGMLPVERFMRDYFRHTSQVSHIVERFVDRARFGHRVQQLAVAVLGHRAQHDLRVGPTHIVATRKALARMRGDLTAIAQILDLANLYDKALVPDTWDLIQHESAQLPDEVSPEAAGHFLSLLSHPTRLPELLRRMHQVGLLEKFIPPFAHARGLLQFNQYHKYTVDEHCIRAVEAAADLADDPGPLGRIYRRIGQKRTLHLALLLHDLGKGHLEDHCEVGVEIVRDLGRRLHMDDDEIDTLRFLVGRHLMMSHLAFHRDTSDESLIVRFAVDVGSPERLQMLSVLTAADLAAVGPGVWNTWKADVIANLHHRAMQHLAGDSPATEAEEPFEHRREQVADALGSDASEPFFARQVAALPNSYLSVTTPSRIAEDLRMLQATADRPVIARGEYQPATHTMEFTVGTSEDVAAGIFHRLTGALTGCGLEILSAEINTLADNLVLDRFSVVDPDFAGRPPRQRIGHVESALVEALSADGDAICPVRKTWQTAGARRATVPLARTRVHADNSTSESYTILDIFAPDRPGLLFAITRALFEVGLSVWRARIATYGEQAVDVFYVTESGGRKVEAHSRLDEIRARLREEIEGFVDDE